MCQPCLLVLYYTQSGNTERIARAIAEGADAGGVQASVKRVEDCGLADLLQADGLALGSPTYFSNVAWQVKRLIDESIELYSGQQLKDKVAGIFTSSGTERDAQDCLRMLEIALGFHHGMSLVEPGLMHISRDAEEKTRTECRQYGGRLAEELLARRVPAESTTEDKER
ncbi:MAG: flavodoxin family protein [Armatimonadetes bacterium]|nr:flavodoxin family protein [Armatimonadota bacterium]